MSKLYACIISSDLKRDKTGLEAVARQFSYLIEMLDDGILFDVSGLERLIGKPDRVAHTILEETQKQNIAGSIAVAATVETAALLARQDDGLTSVHSPDKFQQLPLASLPIEQDTLNIFSELGLRKVEDLLAVPKDYLINRYGRAFSNVVDVIEQKGRQLLTPNVKNSQISWSYHLD